MRPATLERNRPQQFLLYEADWKQYQALRRSMDERGQRAFITFDGHRIELMSPSIEHARASELIGQIVRAIARATRSEFVSGGSTTFKRRDLKRGLEPDRCFWTKNHPKILGVKQIDLKIHPPPDLIIEVEVSRRILDRKGIYARLGVPEIWLYDGKQFRMLELDSEQIYHPGQRSSAFPMVRFNGIERLLQQAATIGELEWQTRVEKWVRKAIAS